MPSLAEGHSLEMSKRILPFVCGLVLDHLLPFRNSQSFREALCVFLTLLRLSLKYVLAVKLARVPSLEEKIFGFTVRFGDYEVFFSLLKEIFVRRHYQFRTTHKSPRIIDCGSNIGMSILFFKRLYPLSTIIGFEPASSAFALLKRNIEANHLRGVEVVEAAVSRKVGTRRFLTDAKNTDGSLLPGVYQSLVGQMRESWVKAVLLSDYIHGPVDFLKMDIEGAEAEVVEELSEKQKLKLIEQMVIEYHSGGEGNRLDRLLEALEANNFQYVISGLLRPPYDLVRDRPYTLMIYAFQRASG